MESDDNLNWDLKLPVIIDCLRKDIGSVVTRIDLPEEERQRVIKLIEQLQSEELKYEDSIRRQIQQKMGSTIEELKQLRDTCVTQQKELDKCKMVGGGTEPFSEQMKSNFLVSEAHLKSIHSIRDDLVNLSMELRLSVEMELSDIRNVISQLTSALSSLTEKYRSLNDAYQKECAHRRKIFNDLQDLRGAIRVFCRVRPLIQLEIDNQETAVIEPIDDTSLLVHLSQNTVDTGKGQRRSDKIYEFDRVFDEFSTQRTVYLEMQGLVTSVLDGFSACIFAYGQTGSGKTYTMEGEEGELEGVIPRTLESLCEEMNHHPEIQYEVTIRMIEIYNEKVYDLLGGNNQVDARLDSSGHVIFPSAVEVKAKSLTEMTDTLKKGNLSRRIASTASNEHSSRSHMLFFLSVHCHNKSSNQSSQGNLVLVDLAGSERVSKTESTGQRLVEGQHINKSLSSLGDVIHALNNKHKHIPFRNSMLTFVLQDVLSEGNKVLMIAQISPAACNVQESLQSLEFANRVNKVMLGKSTENKTHPLIARLNDSNDHLKQELEAMTKELKVFQEKSTLSSDSLGQAEKRVKSLQTLLTEKNMEIVKLNEKITNLDADVAGKTRLLQDRNDEVNQLKKRVEVLELENQTLRSRRSSEATRDSFGSFVDTSNAITSRRFSTVGLSHPSLPRMSIPEKDSMKRSAPSTSVLKLVSAASTLSVSTTNASSSTTSTAPSSGVSGSTRTTGSTVRPQRRISLIERSKMSVPPRPAQSQTVTGVVRTTARRASMITRRTSLVKPPTTANAEPKGVARDVKNAAKVETKVNSGAEQNEKVMISPNKRRRYTVSVNRNSQSTYTFTPSSDRRKTLDSLLLKATKLNESDSSVSNTSEASTFLTATSYRKPDNPLSFLN